MPVLMLTAICALIFSFLYPVQNMHGLAFFATVASLIFTACFIFFLFRLIKKQLLKDFIITRKLLEYFPFVLMTCFILSRIGRENTPHTFDVILGSIWFIATALSIVSLFLIGKKRVYKIFPQLPEIEKTKKSLLLGTLEWIDAFVQAACLVLLINIFIFQLYAIPSESMVPGFMIGDRLLVFKTSAGPYFPLSSFRLPQWKQYARGDIVVFSNPNYPDTPETRLKTFLSQLVYMLTFTQKNINVDPVTKQPKADPLVKRITGIPGEKLMLVDGVLYSKTKDSKDFMPVEADKTYATWDLNTLSQSELRLVHRIVLSPQEMELVNSIESKRAKLNFAEAEKEANSIVARLAYLKEGRDVADASEFITRNQHEINTLFGTSSDISRKILTTNGGLAWFKKFMLDWAPYWKEHATEETLYRQRFAQMNALVKLCFGKLILRNIELINSAATEETFESDSQRNELLNEAALYAAFLDIARARNMDEFPTGEGNYIPENCYFMMGDNRLNSTDMRHSYVNHLEPADTHDPSSILFSSNVEPKVIPAEKILGTTNFRFWPLSRIGVPR
ncbi:signal peptidase I [Treponema phagedenis]|uniref:signal peptidase I n=1 Tax=Treponema phagedenis TaxID=162 RepID=UPI0001F63A0D|nr:signal peptidase I [Treponema phagedenis]EFW39236.1 signal peptidase I [Treponema phagedenis F0421]TYT78129.1 signal peptidase I [Treponema phagedenis]